MSLKTAIEGKKVLTIENLKNMAPDTIFASGVVDNSPEGIFMTRDGGQLRWVAVRGGIWDWAIYCHWSERSEDWIRARGDKVTGESNIKKLVPCNDEAFQMYRY